MDEIGLSQNAQHRQHGAEDKENEDQHKGQCSKGTFLK